MSTKRKYEEFFYYEDGNMARCKLGGCSRPVVCRTQTTSMQKHIKTHHPNDYPRFMELKNGTAPGEEDPKDHGTAAGAGEASEASKDPGIASSVQKAVETPRVLVDRSVSPMPLRSLRAVIESDDEAMASSPPRRRRRVIIESDDETENVPPPSVPPPVRRCLQVHPLQPPRQQRPPRPPQSGRRTRTLGNVRGAPGALDNGEYLVERVESMRREGDRIFWWVKWVGWEDRYSGWEPHENLENARGAIDDYLYDLYGFFAPTVPWLLQTN